MRRVSYEPKYTGKTNEEKSELDLNLDDYESDVDIDTSLLDAEEELSYYEQQQKERQEDAAWEEKQRRDYIDSDEQVEKEVFSEEKDFVRNFKDTSNEKDQEIYDDYRASEEEIRQIEKRIIPQQSIQWSSINISQIPLGVFAIIFSVIFAPVGIILGIIAISTQAKYKKLGWIAIIIGILSIIRFFVGIFN